MARTQRSAKMTTDHDEIRDFVESRGGHPATVKRTGGRQEPGILRIDFPGFSGQRSLQEISWDDFFDKFEEEKLAFLYQDVPDSRFFKLVQRPGTDSERGLIHEKGGRTRRTARAGASGRSASRGGARSERGASTSRSRSRAGASSGRSRSASSRSGGGSSRRGSAAKANPERPAGRSRSRGKARAGSRSSRK